MSPADETHNLLEALSNIFYLLTLNPDDRQLVERCASLGKECMDRLTRRLADAVSKPELD